MKAGQATSLRTKSGFSTVLTTSPGYSRHAGARNNPDWNARI
jgi:hypothetical protein